MKQLEGIKYTKDATGHNRYVHIDLNRYGSNELLEDFLDRLDGLEAQAQKGEETVNLEEFNRYIDEKLKKSEGIRYTKDATGHNRYVRIDLNRDGNYELLEDFLDGLEAQARKGEPTVPLREFLKTQNEKRGL